MAFIPIQTHGITLIDKFLGCMNNYYGFTDNTLFKALLTQRLIYNMLTRLMLTQVYHTNECKV